jgi:hypothetical protein
MSYMGTLASYELGIEKDNLITKEAAFKASKKSKKKRESKRKS